MAGIAIDFSTSERKIIEPMDGYEAVLAGHKFKDGKDQKTKRTIKNAKVTLQFTIASENDAMLFRDYALSPNALYYLKRDLILIGANAEDFNTEPGETVDIDDIITGLHGNPVLLDVTVNETEDESGEVRQFNNITAIHAA